MTDAVVMRLADKPDDCAPYFAIVLVPGWEAAAVSGQLAVVGLGPGDARWLTPEAAGRARRRRRALRLRPLSRPRSGARTARPATPPTIARSARAPRPRSATPRRARRSRSSRAAIPACSPWRRRCARRSRRGRSAWRALDLVDRARRHRDARGRRPGRRAARPRFLRDLALRQSQAVGADRAPARRRGARRLRDRALQSRFRGRGRGSSAPRSSACAGICPTRRRWCSAAPSAAPTSASR